MTGEICANGIYEAEDFAKASKFIRRRLPRRRGAYATIMILPILIILANFLTNPAKAAKDLFSSSALPILAIPAIMGICLYIYFRRRKYNRIEKHLIQRRMKESPLLQGEYRICFSPDGLEASHELIESKTKWSAFKELVETNEYLYFFTTKKSATFVPKRFFTHDEIARIRKLVADHSSNELVLEV